MTHPTSRTPFRTRPKSLKANFLFSELSALIEIWNYKYLKLFPPENPSPWSSSPKNFRCCFNQRHLASNSRKLSVWDALSHDWPLLTSGPEVDGRPLVQGFCCINKDPDSIFPDSQPVWGGLPHLDHTFPRFQNKENFTYGAEFEPPSLLTYEENLFPNAPSSL